LIVHFGSDLSFPITQGTLPWKSILASKLAKLAYLPLFVALAFGNGPVTPEFKRVKGVHPSSISSLATFALLLDLAGISTEFSGRSLGLLSFVSPIR